MSGYNAHFYEVDGKLWFHLEKPAITQPAVPLEFDGPATEDQKKFYSLQLKEFLASKEEKPKKKEEKK